MAITRDAITQVSAAAAVSSVVQAHTIAAGLNNILVVLVGNRTGAIPQMVTWNGAVLQLAIQDISLSASLIYTSIWYLVNPAVGTYDVAVVWPSSVNNYDIGIASYHGVDQADPIDASSTISFDGTTTTPSLTHTTQHDNAWIIEHLVMRTLASETATMGAQTNRVERWNILTLANGLRGAGTTVEPKTTAGPQTLDWTISAVKPIYLTAISLNPEAGGILRGGGSFDDRFRFRPSNKSCYSIASIVHAPQWPMAAFDPSFDARDDNQSRLF